MSGVWTARRVLAVLTPLLLTVAVLPTSALDAQEPDEPPRAEQDTTERQRPIVRGGRGDRPYLSDLAGRLSIGGYAEGHFRFAQTDGIREELDLVAKRFNLFFNSQISDFVRFGAELEFEDAAEEIKLEFLTVDLLVHQAFAGRAGMILLPLGRFNLSHDSPQNPFTDRPFVSTEILSVALSQPGLGAYGIVPLGGDSRLAYEAYAVNGFDEGILDAEDGVRLPEGKENFENNNARLSGVGRVSFSPSVGMDFGVSGMHGQYNESSVDGEIVDENRTVTVGALDWDVDQGLFRIAGEAALANIEVPRSLEGLAASDQWGVYSDVVVPFGRGWISSMAGSSFEAKARFDFVDFDRDVAGDDALRVSVGVNFRPTPDTAFKLDYFKGRTHDRFNNPVDEAGILFSAATYF